MPTEEDYRQMQIDLDEIAFAEFEEKLMQADVETQRRIRDQLDRVIGEYERSLEAA